LSEDEYTNFLANEFENHVQQLGPDNVAAFIAEPIMGAGGVLVAPKGYHRRISELCKKYDVLFVADEVVTAFGRLGEWFSSDTLFDYIPDILIVAKGINSGYIPLGAAIFSEEIYDVISQPQSDGGVFSMGFTYSGHAVACAAALKNFEIIEQEKLLANVRELGPYFQSEAKRVLATENVGDVRGQGFMMGIELVADKASKQSFSAETNSALQVYQQCLKNGLIIRPVGDTIILSPPLTFSKEDIDTMIATIDHGIREANLC
jgi:adenosylmethionine-8-amino-7-oxononanoate aminotransferase